jgi:phosphatidylglycerophosphate synthase
VSGSIVSPELRAKVRGLAEPIGLALARLGFSPNALTLLGFVIACIAAVAAGAQAWLLAGILVVAGGLFDMFDGMVARATGKVSKAGAFLDSVFDRWGEGAVYVGIVVGSLAADFALGAILAAMALTSAFMVSYTRARAESLGFAPPSGMAAIGLAPREVRLAIMTLGLVLTGLAGGVEVAACGNLLCIEGEWGGGTTLLAAALGLIAILATITTIQRIVVTLRQASRQG